MITFILNAFPRTGSTIMFWMLKAGNPDAIHLYEPLHDKLFRLIYEEGSVMHGGNLWDGYKDVSPEILNEMRVKHTDSTNLYRFTDCESYLDVIHSIERDVILQPNRMHFVLKDAAQKYQCKVVHLCRKPADCFLGFAEIFAIYAKNLTKNYNWWIENIYGFVGFFENQYQAIAEKFHAPQVTEFLDEWLIVWTYQNYYAAQQADGKNVKMVFFEDIVSGKGIDAVEAFSGFKLGARDIIDPKKTFLADETFKETVEERIKSLDLINMVEAIYDAARI